MGREYIAPRSAAEALQALHHETELGWRRPDLVEPFVTLVETAALEKFRGAVAETPVELDDLATDLHLVTDAAAALAASSIYH